MSRNFIFSVATRAWRFLPAKLFYTFAIGAKDVPGYFREFAGTLRRKWECKIDQKCTKTDTNAARAHEKRLTKQEEKLELSPRLAWGQDYSMTFFIRAMTSGGWTSTSLANVCKSLPSISSGSSRFFFASEMRSGSFRPFA